MTGPAIDPATNFASAELFFGVAWDPEFLDARAEKREPSILGLAAGDEEGAWWKTLLMAQGYTDPWLTAPAESSFDGDEDAYVAAHRAWREEREVDIDTWRRAARLLQERYGVDVGWHGSSIGGGTRYPHLFVVGSVSSAAQWEPKPITAADMVAGPTSDDDWVGRIEAFARDLEIDLSDGLGPCWLLTASLA